jgi:SAM-dependent methyltransferase
MSTQDSFDFNELLHELRGAELLSLQKGRRFLSAGCSGAWYFEWIEEKCSPERHIGIELYSPKPDKLPVNAEWIAASVGEFRGVPNGSIDIVFSGQNFEHLSRKDVYGFLIEAFRVLGPTGVLVIDTPNRAVTAPMVWCHPEHVAEFTVDELQELLEAAGFEVTKKVGHWLMREESGELLPLGIQSEGGNRFVKAAYRRLSQFLPMAKDSKTMIAHRIAVAKSQPESAFSLWIEARRRSNTQDIYELDRALERLWEPARRERISRSTISEQCIRMDEGSVLWKGKTGAFTLWGPYTALFTGRYKLTWNIKLITSNLGSKNRLGFVDVQSQGAEKKIAHMDLEASQFPRGEWQSISLLINIEDYAFGVEFRLYLEGNIEVMFKPQVNIESCA